jgi:hypothetical protein
MTNLLSFLRERRRALAGLGVAVALLAAAGVLVWPLRRFADPRPALTRAPDEATARAEFQRRHPGEKPLNWRIGEIAEQFYREQPMGKFVLGLTPGKWGNDCSDFVDCIADEALGARARFHRGSREHLIGSDATRYFVYRAADQRNTPQPGDFVLVRHSPWYAPSEEACWHVGAVGADGQVYDFVKLISWPSARYGRHDYAWFTRHCGPGEVLLGRLRPQYRYELQPIVIPLKGHV